MFLKITSNSKRFSKIWLLGEIHIVKSVYILDRKILKFSRFMSNIHVHEQLHLTT